MPNLASHGPGISGWFSFKPRIYMSFFGQRKKGPTNFWGRFT